MIRVMAGMMAVVLSCSLWAMAQGDVVKTTQGVVQEDGFGKFRLKDKAGTSWLFYLSHDKTRYTPDDWRPIVGDEVNISHMEVQSRGNTISQAVTVGLVKAGPNTIRIKSPVEVQITETGRSGYKAKVLSTGVIVRFGNQRSSQVVPTGWVPTPGEKALVTFTAQPSKIWGGFGISYALDKIEKIDAGGKTK
jgi:hypothetical protein